MIRAGRWQGISLIAALTLAAGTAGAQPGPGFVTREGSSLVLDGTPFRFLSVNIPNFHIVEDPMGPGQPAWHRVSAGEQEDALKAVEAFGGRVIRIYVPSVEGGKNNTPMLSHVYRGPNGQIAYNEALFRDLDRGLALAARYGVRVILPLVDQWDWFGGPAQWQTLAGGGDFWTDPTTRRAFHDFVRWLAARVNTVTGVAYRDDPTILAWELGNELKEAPDSWVTETAAVLKAAAPRHLVMDGGFLEVRPVSLTDPNIDIVTTHYTDDALVRFAKKVAKAGKVYVYGEFDPARLATVADALSRAPIAGALVWSLRFRSDAGTFYEHRDFGGQLSLRYPVETGFWVPFARVAESLR